MRYDQHPKRLVWIRYQERLADYAVDRAEKAAKRRADYQRRIQGVNRDRTYSKRAGPRASKTPRYFLAPESLNLADNIEETVAFLMKFRGWTSSTKYARSFYLDLRPVRSISPAGALLLVAELHRWRLIYSKRLRALDADEWNPQVRALLAEMGFFDLLEVDRSKLPSSDGHSPTGSRFLPFKSGVMVDTRPFLELRDMIEALTGRLQQRLSLYQAVSEAITNVLHHAYPVRNKLSRWWMSASMNIEESKLTVMVLDHGLGIPKTLPRTITERVRHKLSFPAITSSSDDGAMIEAAVQLGRSSVMKPNRGHGLQRDIHAAIRNFDGKAKLRIHSNRGKYVFEKNFEGEQSTMSATIKKSLDGTFIEWTFALPQLGLRLHAH
jgi:hypothetical protein